MEVIGSPESDFLQAFSMETQPHQSCAVPACISQPQRTVMTSLHTEPIYFAFSFLNHFLSLSSNMKRVNKGVSYFILKLLF